MATEAQQHATMRRRLPRVIDQLRKLFPGHWTYEGWGLWQGPAFAVVSTANLCNNYDGDESWYVTYCRTDTGERVPVVDLRVRRP